jgi:RHS repeat-associated protein
MGFDKLGRRTSLVDPDAGASVYGYNGLDELVMQKDAEDLQDPADPGTVLVRDRAGRVPQRSDDDGLTKYVWDTAPHGMGQLRTATSPDGVLTAYSYDVYGREEAVTTTVAGAAYEVRRSFDPEGRVDRVFYPEVPGRPRLTLANHYNVRGYLDSVTDVSFGVGAPPFALLAGRNAGLAPTAMLLGDGSLVGRDYDPATGRLTHVEVSGPAPLAIDTTYHPDGNLKTRDEPLLGRFEVFSYDALDRLSEWTLTASNAETTTTYDYDELGNLTRVWKGAQVVTHNLYGANGKPHALSSDLYGLFSPNQYDARGRLVSGRGRALTYNEANLPLTVTTSQGTTGFGYDAFGKRTWKEAPTGQTLYVGELYERRAAGGLVEHVFHVVGPTGVVADVVYDEASTTEEVVYLQQDGLGSTVQTQGAFGASRQYFEPFGARIDADGTAAPPQPVDTVGFTGHLHDDDLGLIAMRGRIYDPGMRRFLTPDPVVQAPFFGQSYNRYAYVMNNPLRYVDPSGFQAVGAGEEPSTSAPGALDGPQINPGGQDAQAQPECGGGLVTGCVITVYVHGTKPGSANKTAESAGENGAPSTPTPAGGAAPDDSEDLGALASAFGHGGTAGTVPFGGLFIRQEKGATPAQQFAYGLGEFLGGFLTMVVAPFTGGTPGVSNPGDKAAPLAVGPGGVAVLGGVGAKVTVGVRIVAVVAAVASGAIAATDGMATMSSALGDGPGTTPRAPQKVSEVLAHVRRHGSAPPNVRGGSTFANDGRGGRAGLADEGSGGKPDSIQRMGREYVPAWSESRCRTPRYGNRRAGLLHRRPLPNFPGDPVTIELRSRPLVGEWGHLALATLSDMTDALWRERRQRPGDLVVQLRGHRMGTAQAVFDEVGAALQFPYYFGDNWNAFEECLNDMSWMPAKAYTLVILDSDRVVDVETDELPTLLRILARVCDEWHHPPQTGQPWERPPTSFRVVLHCTVERAPTLEQRLRSSGIDLHLDAFQG